MEILYKRKNNFQVENIVAKGDICHYEHFPFLSQCFYKLTAEDASEFVYNWERVKC